MKKLGLIMVLIFVLALLAGCLPSWLQPGGDEPVESEPEVVVNAVLAETEEVDEDGVVVVGGELVPAVLWSIENISEDHIYDYSLTFTVLYEVRTQWTEVVSGVNLYPTDVDFGTLILPDVGGMEPETLITVLATY